jgi:small neutral amino acid transporter SnatA (MarC family)
VSAGGSRPAARAWRAGLVLALILVLVFAVGSPPERCPSVSPGELRRSSQAAVDWFVRNQEPDGDWLYEYNAEDDSVSSADYNEVRHAGATMGLYQAAAAGLPGALRSADTGAEWALARLEERDDWSALSYNGRTATGSTALLVAGLAIRREATRDKRYDEDLRRLGRFLLAQTEPSGAVLAEYDAARGEPLAGEYSKYYTGEAYWALALLHRSFPAEGWDEAADRIGAYLATSRDEIEDHWPPIPDHWAAYGQAETVGFPDRGEPPLSGDEADYAREQAGQFGMQARYLGQLFGPWGGLVRGSYEPRGGWYGVVGEAVTGWWLTAQEDARLAELRAPLAERARCVAGLALEKQSDAEDAAGASRPERVEGAWFVDGTTRMDDQQHALAGLLRTIPIAQASASESSGDDTPSDWLWAAVLLLALNPARAAFGVPRAGRTPRAVAELAAGGGIAGALAVCAVALLGDPLLDALDVSEPSFRIAAGVVAALAGAIDLFRRPPSPEPALEGWGAALVPVAIPLVARPALLVLALGAGADSGVLVSVGAMAVGVVALTPLAAGPSIDGPRGRVLHWAARLLAVGLVALGVLLALDGILAV